MPKDRYNLLHEGPRNMERNSRHSNNYNVHPGTLDNGTVVTNSIQLTNVVNDVININNADFQNIYNIGDNGDDEDDDDNGDNDDEDLDLIEAWDY